jgi:Xaa-Pro dipeptidase
MEKEIEIKWERVRRFLKEKALDGFLINKVSNFAWFTGGKINYVGLHTEIGVCKLLITENKIYYLTNNIEYPRISEEELKNLGFEPVIENWYEENFIEKIREIGCKYVGADIRDYSPTFVPFNIEKLHYPLLPQEIDRYKELGKRVSEVMTEVCKEIKLGEKEVEVAGRLSKKLLSKNIIPIVLLIASDERIERYRHPVPTEKEIERYVMVVLCARKYGLIVSLTRLVHFGKLSDELKKKHISVCKVDAVFINSTKKGVKISDVFEKGVKCYEEMGFPEEWRKHHQGGPTGYSTRYFRATKYTYDLIEENQAFAWNPSITGTKSEDTIITVQNQQLIITEDKNWPMVKVEVEDKEILRPDILIK